MRIVTWNINSVRLRADLFERLSQWLAPDVICLQETKVVNELFPTKVFETLGYPHIAHAGMKSYNGVAIISKFPLENVSTRSFCEREDCRHIMAHVAGPVAFDLHCLYIPAGGDIPDPIENKKFAHKLEFLDEAAAWFPTHTDPARPAMLVGDLNIAPLPTDVWSHKQLLSVVSHTPIEVEKLGILQRSARFTDAVRHFVPADQKLYSWWSYRNRDWAASDRGRRLDHIWVSPELVPDLTEAEIHRPLRGWEKASDHVPVTVTFGG